MESQTFGRYQIQAELGRGGMAIVYHAFDPRFDRNVALKILPREFLFDQNFRARFEREARAIASLEHSAIAPVYDFGEEDGQPFFIMRFMPGGSLSDLIRQRQLSLDEIQAILARIASALDFAHQKSVIHRDVKPANILFDEAGDPYLADFGIVKLTEASAQLTSKGMVGTPSYMAPEMMNANSTSPLIDVYALGVTLFQMLTGKLPYKADTPIGTLMAHMNKPVPAIRHLRPDLPDAMQAVIEQAMAKNPAERFQSAGAVTTGLAVAISSAPLDMPETIETYAEEPTIAVPTPPDAVTTDVLEELELPATLAPERISEPRVQRVRASKTPNLVLLGGGGLLITVILAGILVIAGVFGGATATEPQQPVVTLAEEGATVQEETPEEETAESSAAEPTAAPAATPIPLGFAGNPVTANADWTSQTQTFEGVEMALVPAGCFMMGSEDGDSDEETGTRAMLRGAILD